MYNITPLAEAKFAIACSLEGEVNTRTFDNVSHFYKATSSQATPSELP